MSGFATPGKIPPLLPFDRGLEEALELYLLDYLKYICRAKRVLMIVLDFSCPKVTKAGRVMYEA